MISSKLPPRVAIVYDWTTSSHGGAERVLKALKQAFPGADLFSAIGSSAAKKWLNTWPVQTSFLNQIPGAAKFKDLLAWLLPLAFESLDLRKYQVVISVTSSFAKSILTTSSQLHICYLLSPPRFLYSHESDYQKTRWWFKLPLVNQIYRWVKSYLKMVDYATAYRPDLIVPISQLVLKRSKSAYGLIINQPIYPTLPVNFQPIPYSFKKLLPQYLLIVSRLVAYKHHEIAILAALENKRSVIVVGEGPEMANLVMISGSAAIVRARLDTLATFFARHQKRLLPSIYFVRSCSDQEVSWLYQSAQALLIPAVEDFGITGIEAALHGIPTILPKQSGVAEQLDEAINAVYSSDETLAAFSAAVKELETRNFVSEPLQTRAVRYDTEAFISQFRTYVANAWKEHLCKQHSITLLQSS